MLKFFEIKKLKKMRMLCLLLSVKKEKNYKTPLHLHKATKFLGYKKKDFPNAERITEKVLSFPHHQHLKKKEIMYVVDKINKFYNKI